MEQSESHPSVQITTQWEWKSNYNPFLTSEDSQWIAFKPLENYLLETAFSNNEKEVDLGDYIVSIEEGLQKKKGDLFKQRQVRRNTQVLKNNMDQEENIRAQRFFGAEIPRTFNKVFGNLSDFLTFFQNRSSELKEFANLFSEIEESGNLDQLNDLILPFLIDCITDEAKKVPKDSKSKEKLVSLFQDPFKSFKEFYGQVLRAYTLETFLYKNANLYLRNEDWIQLDTLLPYVYCLCKAFFRSELLKKSEKMTLYRGAAFDEIALSFYDQNITRNFGWSSMTSTSIHRKIAEKFMHLNTDAKRVPVIFIIEVSKDNLNWIDVEPFSVMPHEDEIVLAPGSVFEITGVSKNSQKVVEINLKLLNNVNNLVQQGQVFHGAMQSEMAKDGQLKIVCLEGKELSETIPHLRGNRLIKELEFCLCRFNENALVTLKETLQTVPNLKKFIFSSPSFADQTQLSDVLKVLENLHLEALEIYGKDSILSESEFINVAKGISCLTSLQALTLDFCQCKEITDKVLSTLCLEGIQHLKSLTYLSLNFHEWCYITDKGLENLSLQGIQHLTALTTLILNFNVCSRISDEGLKDLCLKGIKGLTLLISLNLNFRLCNKITDRGLGILSSQGFKYFSFLRSLNLNFRWNLAIGDQGLMNFCHEGIPHLKLLTSLTLNFSHCKKITDEGFGVLACKGIRYLTSLEFLSLNFGWCMKVTDEGLSNLTSQALKYLTSLRALTLDFQGCRWITDKSLESLHAQGIQLLPSLTSLTLEFDNCAITDMQTLQELLGVKKQIPSKTEKSTKSIVFERELPNKILNRQLAKQKSQIGLTTKEELESFAAQNVAISYETMEINANLFSEFGELCRLMTSRVDSLSSLSSLILNFTKFRQITNEDLSLSWFQGVRYFTSLESLTLDFSSCEITDKGLNDLACQAIQSLTSLTCLNLKFPHCQQITDEGLANLWCQGVQHLVSLTSLVLNFEGCEQITNQGLNNLNCEGMKNLRTLSLCFNSCYEITDEGVKNLCCQVLRHLVSLTSLTLDLTSCYSITDQGLSVLGFQGIHYLSSLTLLNLCFNACQRITDGGMNNLCLKGIKHLASLSSLTLDFQHDFEVTDEALNNLYWQGIKHLTSLTYLSLHFDGCKRITDVAWKNFHKILRYFGFQPSQQELRNQFEENSLL